MDIYYNTPMIGSGKKDVSPDRFVSRGQSGQADVGSGETEEVVCPLHSGDCSSVNSLCDILISQITKMICISEMADLGQYPVVCFYGKFKSLSLVLVSFLLAYFYICAYHVSVITGLTGISIPLIPVSCPVGLNLYRLTRSSVISGTPGPRKMMKTVTDFINICYTKCKCGRKMILYSAFVSQYFMIII